MSTPESGYNRIEDGGNLRELISGGLPQSERGLGRLVRFVLRLRAVPSLLNVGPQLPRAHFSSVPRSMAAAAANELALRQSITLAP